MRASPYNNPLFAEGLAGLIEGFIGNPVSTAQAELMAAQALNENLTAQYRQGMDVGLSSQGSNLSDMMVRALQAGNQYSGNAPKISAAINQNNRGILGMPTRGGGGGGSNAAKIAEEMNMLDQKRALEVAAEYAALAARDVVANNPDLVDQEESVANLIQSELLKSGGSGPDAFSIGSRVVPEEYTVDENAFFGPDGSWNPFNMLIGPETGYRPSLSPADPTAGIGQPGGKPTPQSEEEYRALPSGTHYIAPDGTTRVKP